MFYAFIIRAGQLVVGTYWFLLHKIPEYIRGISFQDFESPEKQLPIKSASVYLLNYIRGDIQC